MSEDKGSVTLTSKQKISKDINMSNLLKFMFDHLASDLHISIGTAPCIRVNGEILRMKTPPLSAEDTKRLAYELLTETQKNYLEKNLELDFSFGVKDLARFRANVFYSRGGVAAVLRAIPANLPSFDQLNLPKVLLRLSDASSGIVLVTGPTGSGKSTTLASLLNHVNANSSRHIVTLEDPVEFIHDHKGCIVNQREVGRDTHSFQDALKSLLRQDPDIVLVGELRDMETIENALKIAETGHLVFATLHTNSAVQTINRIVNVFPADQQDQIRTLLSFVLQGVVSQQLIPKSYEPGRVCALEVMLVNPAIRNLIREEKIHQIYSQMQIGQEKTGMITMNQSLIDMIEKGLIDGETALQYSSNQEELANKLKITLK